MPDELSDLDAAVARVLGWTNLAMSDWDRDAADPLDVGRADCGGFRRRRVVTSAPRAREEKHEPYLRTQRPRP
jgi:hypothetical protein